MPLAALIVSVVLRSSVFPGAVDSTWMIEWTNEQRASSIDKAQTRANVMARRLRSVEALPQAEAVPADAVTLTEGMKLPYCGPNADFLAAAWLPGEGAVRMKDKSGRLKRVAGMVEERSRTREAESRINSVFDR